jgi:integrase
MPLTLVPPRAGRSKHYRVRGTHRGVYLDRTTETGSKTKARQFLNLWQGQIDSGKLSGEKELTFAQAALSYIRGGGVISKKLIDLIGPRMLAVEMDQAKVDEIAMAIFPNSPPSTRNRWVYTPICATLAHAKIDNKIKRPKGHKGRLRTVHLSIEQFDRVEDVAWQSHPELAVLFCLLFFTGLRLGEALSIKCGDVRLNECLAICGKTKNGDPRGIHLTPRVIAALASHPRGLDRPDSERLFGFTRASRLYKRAGWVYAAAGVDDGGAPFHVLRHSYGAAMTRLGVDLVSTGVWRDPGAARTYQHFVPREEAMKADLLPGARRVK